MAFSNKWCIVMKQDTGLAAEKQWVCDVFRSPNQVPASGTAGSDTTGPLGSGGSATANKKHGDGTSAGFPGPYSALQTALVFLMDDRSLNGTP